ncbi:MAG TPA: glycosyltransferase [Alphaproteobacteria bacterium]
MAPMRILHVMAGSKAGGAETAFAELCAAQKRAGMDVYAACRPSRRNMDLSDAGVPVTELPFGGLFDFKTKRNLSHLIRQVRPEVVVTWMNRAAKKLPKKVPGVAFTWVPRLGGYYNLKYYEGAQYIVVNAPDIARWMEEHGTPANAITFIPNFAEMDAGAIPVPRASLDTPEDAFVFVTLARLHSNKGIDTLLSAFADVPNAYLWIAGDGPESSALKRQALDLNLMDRVRFLGWRDDRWSLLAAADAVVFPSRHEPFGNSFMQAWAAGKALVTTASQGPSYYVQNEKDALVVPIDDIFSLSAAMKRVQNDPNLREALANAGQTRYSQAFDKQAILDQWTQLFDRVRP